MKVFLALTVLLNYLALLLMANTPAQKFVPTAETPYVHADDCQQHNYLKLDCFDTCNAKYSIKHSSEKNPLNQASIVVNGFDFHYGPSFIQVIYQVLFSMRSTTFSMLPQAAVCGFLQLVIPPPEV